MSTDALLGEFHKLTLGERVRFLQQAWESLGDEATFSLTLELREELDRRLSDYESDPLSGEPWDAVKAELLRKL